MINESARETHRSLFYLNSQMSKIELSLTERQRFLN